MSDKSKRFFDSEKRRFQKSECHLLDGGLTGNRLVAERADEGVWATAFSIVSELFLLSFSLRGREQAQAIRISRSHSLLPLMTLKATVGKSATKLDNGLLPPSQSSAQDRDLL